MTDASPPTLFEEPGPHVFNAPAGTPFPSAFAEGVIARLRATGADLDALADIEIIVSTQRAVRALRSAFVTAAGGAALGPRLRTLGDIGADFSLLSDDAPPAIDKMRRALILTRLVRALLAQEPSLGAPSVAAALASDLAGLLDSAQAAGAALEGLDAIEEGGHAAHWALSRRFLTIIRDVWPSLLAAEGRIDPEDRRRRVVAAFALAWAAAPPSHPIIVAGSTGSLDTSAWFISLVAAAPQGAVVLPGLDTEIDAAAVEEIAAGRAPEHPQAGLITLCRRIGVSPGDVRSWAEATRGDAAPRARWLNQALRPAPVTDAWRFTAPDLAASAPQAMAKVALMEAANPREEAVAIAIALREALETPDRTAALITPDRTLARRVAAELGRWGIEPDDSSGRPLPLTAPGVFLGLTFEAALSDLAPAPLLALLKHPICAAGFDRGAHLRATRRFEREILRADRLAATRDFAEAIAALEEPEAAEDDPARLIMTEWWSRVASLLEPLRAVIDTDAPDFAEILRAHAETAIALSRREGQEEPELFERAAGETLRGFLAKIEAAAADFGPIDAREYPLILAQMMGGEAVREAFGRHPRIAILGPLEARMQTADLVILAGLNEGIWPQIPEPDPWLGRDMRAQLGLPPLESRIGLSAHDFCQAAMAETAILSRSRRSDGAPTTPSRWWLRLTTLLTGVAGDTLAGMTAKGEHYLALARRLDTPAEALAPASLKRLKPAARPKPTPPLDARPTRLSATEVETLIRDPYAVYVRRTLRLRPLAELADGPDARDRGDILHRLVERYVRATMAATPASPAGLYDSITDEVLAPIAAWPSLYALWSARARNMRDWFLKGEAERRSAGRPVALEALGRLTLPTALGEVLLTAQADRIDQLNGGEYVIYDYKTGEAPTAKQIDHFAKQLPLEAAILAATGFEGAPAGLVAAFSYLRLQGGRSGGKEASFDDATRRAQGAVEGLAKLLGRYANPDQPYAPRTRPEFLRYDGQYDHLARYGEWADGA